MSTKPREDAKYLFFLPKTIAECLFPHIAVGVVIASAAPKLEILRIAYRGRKGKENGLLPLSKLLLFKTASPFDKI